LAEISLAVAPGAHALVLLVQAGWHGSTKLPIPDNITLLPLSPKSPELNPVENIWQFMRDNWLSNRVLKSYDDILDHCCFAWNKLIDMPNYVHRDPKLGLSVMINGTWYNAAQGDHTPWQDETFRWGQAASDWDPKLPRQAGPHRSHDEGLWLPPFTRTSPMLRLFRS
jgi:DDE superfamily endonuclease